MKSMRKYNLSNASPTIRVVLLGDHDVGKSALVVRFLTKRFIGEYVSGQEITYQQEVTLSGNKVTVEICDALVKKNPPSRDNHRNKFMIARSWFDSHPSYVVASLDKMLHDDYLCLVDYDVANQQKAFMTYRDEPDCLKQLSTNTDAYMIVYSVCSRESFNYACQLAEEAKTIHRNTSPDDDPPILLVGNKSDLDHFREVKRSEGETFSKSISRGHFIETSAAESYSDVEQAFRVVFQLARAQTGTSPTPTGQSSRLGRKNSLTQVAQLIRDHYRKGHLSHSSRANSLERGLSLFKNNSTQHCEAGYPLSPDISSKRKSRKLISNSYSQEQSALSSGKPRLSSKCLSLGTLTEDPVTEELDSLSADDLDKSDVRPKYDRPKSMENSMPQYLTEDSCNNEDSSSSLDANKMSLSSDDAMESSDVSTPEEEAFSSENSSSAVSPRDTPTTDEMLNKHLAVSDDQIMDYTQNAKRLINKKNLQIDVYSDGESDESVFSGSTPNSSPLVHSASNQKFRYFPNGVNENSTKSSWSSLTSATVPISPLLNHKQKQRIKSPKEDKKSPAQNFLKQFFKSTLQSSSTNRGYCSNPNLNSSLASGSSEELSSFDDGSSSTLTGSLGEGGPVYFHASSTSLSSIISSDKNDFDSVCSSSAPTTPRMRKSGKKSRRPSIREAVGGLMRKRKQSVSIEYLKQNTNKERVL